jgi:histidyl-tRNA synthetase
MYEKKRGRDLLPSDMIRFRHVERVFREEAIRFGYQEIRTPTIEPLSLFTSAGTLDPRMLDDLYSFLDWDGWSGERVVLRPEGTIPTGRLFLEHLSDKKSARLFYISNMFSYDEGGTSEHWQCGGELIERTNKNKAQSDTEILALSFSVLKKMGFESPHIRIGYPPLVREILNTSGLSPDEMDEILGLITERDMEGVRRASEKKNLKKLLGLLDLTSTSVDFIKNVRAYLPKSSGMKTAIGEFEDSISALSDADIPFEINFTLPLNFEYYTGLVIEVYPSAERTQKPDLLISGGRYDNLISIMSGGDINAQGIQAVGFALKVENVIECPEFIRSLASMAVLVEPEDNLESARKIVSNLRDRGFIAEIAGVGQDKSNFRWRLSIAGDSIIILDSETGKSKSIKKKGIKDFGDILSG